MNKDNANTQNDANKRPHFFGTFVFPVILVILSLVLTLILTIYIDKVKAFIAYWSTGFAKPGIVAEITAFLCGVAAAALFLKIKNKIWRRCLIAIAIIVVFCIPIIQPNIVDKNLGYCYPDTLYLSPPKYGGLATDTRTWRNVQDELQKSLDHLRVLDKSLPRDWKITVIIDTNVDTDEELSRLGSGNNAVVAFLGCGMAVAAAQDPKYHYFPLLAMCDTNLNVMQYRARFIISSNSPLVRLCTDFPSLVGALKAFPDSYTFGLGDKRSNSSYKIPKLLLNQYGIDPKFTSEKSQPDLIERVKDGPRYSGGIDIACVASDELDRDHCDSLKVIDFDPGANWAWTNSFPSTSIGWRSDLAVPIQLCIINTLAKQRWHPTDRLGEVSPQTAGIVALGDFEALWANALKVDQAFASTFPDDK